MGQKNTTITIQYYDADIRIKTNPNITLSQLKTKIHQQIGIKPESQTLYFE